MDRLSAHDAAFLHLEDANNPMHLGSVAIFQGPPPSYGDLVRHVADRITLVPRYRQVVRFVPLALGRPIWVDDEHFQILYHVRHGAVPRPGGREQLRNLAGRVFAQNLDRSKPLWELWLVEGLPDEQWALISKVHHCMVDGVATVDMLASLMDLGPETAPVTETRWDPAPAPRGTQLAALAIADGVSEPLELLPRLARNARPLLRGAGMTLSAWQAMLETILRGRPTVRSLNGPLGPNRRWSWITSSLDDAKRIRASLGGTINDVVLAAVTRGFRDLLLERGEDITDRVVRTLVPVSLRAPDEQDVYTNRVAGYLPDLPVSEPDPHVRLNEIRAQMDEMKRQQRGQAGDVLTQISGYVPPALLEMGVRLARDLPQRTVNTVTTNVPGPQQPLFMLGRQLLAAHPYVPIGGNMQLGVAVFSYLGRLNFGVTADYDSGADIDVLCRGIEAGLAELLELAERPRARKAATGANGNGRRRSANRTRAAARRA